MKFTKFFRENGYLAVKLIVVHIAMSIFGLMVYLPFDTSVEGNASSRFIALILGIISVIFYFFMIYHQIWDVAAKEELRVVGGKKVAYPAKGFLVGLVAAIPDFIVCAGYVIFSFFESYEWAATPSFIFKLIMPFWEGMFMALRIVVFPRGSYFFIFIPFVTVLFAGVSYIFGMKNIRLLPVEDTPEERERREEAKRKKKEDKAKSADEEEE